MYGGLGRGTEKIFYIYICVCVYVYEKLASYSGSQSIIVIMLTMRVQMLRYYMFDKNLFKGFSIPVS